jgi:hypothetical protein
MCELHVAADSLLIARHGLQGLLACPSGRLGLLCQPSVDFSFIITASSCARSPPRSHVEGYLFGLLFLLG